MSGKVLVVDDEKGIRYTTESFLLTEGYEVQTAAGLDEALEKISGTSFDLVIADILLGGRSGIDLLREIRRKKQYCPVVMMTGAPSVDTASEAVRLGAYDYVSKPLRKSAILNIARRAIEHKEILEKMEAYRANLEAIFSSVKDAIITVDRDLAVIEVNEASSSICGMGRDAIGKPLAGFQTSCGGLCMDAVRATAQNRRPINVARIECGRAGREGQVVSVSTYPLMQRGGDFSGVVLTVRDETRMARLERDLKQRQGFHGMVGESKRMQEIYALIETLAKVNTTVLITGESGTGKELVVDALHYTGDRRDKPLVKVNCSALSENLLESELFGHLAGSFTGAISDKVGMFELAHGGTIFLDEIGDISQKMQVSLLRVLQEHEIQRVGDTKRRKVDVRVVAATNQNLQSKIKKGQFRTDLFYRLKVVEIYMPRLSERTEDIPLLVRHFIGKFNANFSKRLSGVSPDVGRAFMQYAWPGNVRELEHVLEHASILCEGDIVNFGDLPPEFGEMLVSKKAEDPSGEREAIINALKKASWNKTGAARILGISRPTLYKKMGEHDISHE